MKLSKRERFLIGVLLLVLVWVLALRFLIAPSYGSLVSTRLYAEELKQEKAKMDLYLDQNPHLPGQLLQREDREDQALFFYQDIDDVFIDRTLQSMAKKAGVKIRKMDIEDPGAVELPQSYTGGPEAPLLRERIVTMEIESPQEENIMLFADEIYRDNKSLVVTLMDVKRETGTGAVMKGIVEVKFYYEETGQEPRGLYLD